MKICYLAALLVLAGCQPTASVSSDAPKIMTYQELVDYPVDCKFKETQVAELKKLQAIKNFDPDPDLLNAEDYDFNGRLKATIWWYTYRCDQS